MIQHQVVEYLLLPDEREPLEKELKRLADQRQVHVIFTTGGTGFSVRDITPEATIAVCDRMANGIADAIRNYSMTITPRAMFSRAVSGLRGRTLIVNLPGSPKNEKAVVQIFKATYGETFDFEFYSEKEREIFLSRYAGAKLPQKQGIKELLQWLKDNGIKTAVASSTNRETVKQELADGGLLDYFSVVIGGDMIERSKPAPDIFMEACRQLNVLPEDSFIIEDSYNGIRAAHAAGAKAIMVPDLLQPTEEIRELVYSVQDSLVHVRKMLEQEINF